MTNFIISLIGYFLIFVACDINRKEESKISFFSFDYVLQILLVSIGTQIIIHYAK